MIDAGKLKITLSCDNGKMRNVEIESTRPLHTSRLFIGKTPEQTLKMLPLLFNVCGVAQSFAAFQALGIAQNSAEFAARNLLLNVEIVREHCWWLLINTDKARLAPFLKYVTDFKKALFVGGDAFSLNSRLEIQPAQLENLIFQLENDLNTLFENGRESLLQTKNEDDLSHWLEENSNVPANLLRELLAKGYQNLGQSPLQLLPELAEVELLAEFETVNFSKTPTWRGECYETSCLNREQTQPLIADLLKKYGNGLITRLTSRLFELANLPNVLRQNFINMQTPSNPTENEMGVVQIQASRGLLIHKVEMKNGLISDYQIVAPTEWNFHPNGVAALSLQSLCVHNETLLRQHAALIINAIDPCVGFELVIN